MATPKGPLAGLKVIELAHIMSGPSCGLLLADMGADVIKVEKMPAGDDTRRYVPPEINGESAAFLMMNRNKRGIAVNLKHEGGKDVLRRLVGRADVLTENYRAGTMEKLGLGYEALRQLNPRLVYCAISGFGRTGPFADKGGFDLVAQGMSGLMSITGEPGQEPVKCGPPVTDIGAGMLAALGIVAAYVHRLRTGEGQRVDTSLFEAGVMQTYWHSAIALATGKSPGPLGSAHLLTAPYQAFPTRDGWINIGAANQANWERLLKVLEAPELAVDPRFGHNAGRMQHRDALVAALTPHLRGRSTAEWVAVLDAAGIPVGPVLSISEMLVHPQTVARQMVIETAHPRVGKAKGLGLPIKFSAGQGSAVRSAPVFGQHTREVLREHGYSDADIEALAREGAVAVAAPPPEGGAAGG
ncbi:MAG TPA: CaiB/BaiF CoA-transferase family protein [Burkholderiales bacterium]|nr:CaiB/BaiF CoA-transferase family protein [Burkholderiales bacterium]